VGSGDALEVRTAAALLEWAKAEGSPRSAAVACRPGVTKQVLRAALEAEMSEHMGYEKGQGRRMCRVERAQRVLAEDDADRGRSDRAADSAGSGRVVHSGDRA
jgi:hypothetical protein